MNDNKTWLLDVLADIERYAREKDLKHVAEKLIECRRTLHRELGATASDDTKVNESCDPVFFKYHRASD